MLGYAVALLASWCYQGAVALKSVPSVDDGTKTVHPYQGALAHVPVRIAWTIWPGEDVRAEESRAPVILIHGAPGSKEDWGKLAPLLAKDRDVYAVDLPGFGASSLRVPDHSLRAGAAAIRAWMDATGIGRAHVVGWSNGGGVALHLAHESPARLASMSLLASIGEQRFEGSGSHTLEHGRYGLALLALGPGLDLVPHFGVLGTREARTGWIRGFSQSDQRPLGRMMQEIGAMGMPTTLIVHGRSDFLVPVRTAIGAHEKIAGSRLVLMDASHFIPFMQPGAAAEVLGPFFRAADDGPALNESMALSGPVWLREGARVELDPSTRSMLQRAAEPVRGVVRGASPWVLIGAIGTFAFFAPALAAACATMLVLGLDIDYLVAILGVFAGLLGRDVIAGAWARGAPTNGLRSRSPTARAVFERLARLEQGSMADWERRLARAPFHEAWTACLMRDVRESSLPAAARVSVASLPWGAFVAGRVWGSVLVAIVSVMGSVVVGTAGMIAVGDAAADAFERAGVDVAVLWVPMLLALWMVARVLPMLASRRGRTRMSVFVRRLLHHEFWRTFWFYAPFGPMYVYLAIRHRGLLVWTCCNPGIAFGGGILGECKSECFERFGVCDLAADARGAGPDSYAAGDVGIWPYAVVPAGGSASERAVLARAVLARELSLGGLPIVLKPDSGFRGLGLRLVRTDEQLAAYFEDVHAAVLMQRFHPGPLECSILWVRTLPPGANADRVGTIYSITDKQFQALEGDGVRTLEELIDRDRRARLQRDTFRARHADRLSWVPAPGESLKLNVAGNHCQGTIFRDGEHLRTPELERAIDRFCASYRDGGLDLVRLDVRYTSPLELREGRGLAIVDVNGTMGESVNMYDPDRAYPWALRVLSGHWKHMFAIGAWRRSQGVKPLSLIELVRLRGFYGEYRGSRVSD